MAAGRASFEVQALRDDRWVAEDLRETESAARAAAKATFAKGQCQGIRIVKNWLRADGIMTETVIFTETREPEPPQVTIVPISTAPFCHRTEEYYRLESRITINRLFRKYIEKMCLTPTELIHNYRALKKIQEVDTLFPAAVDRVATLQARISGDEPRMRRDEVFTAVAQMAQKARRAEENTRLPQLKGIGFDKVIHRIERIVPPEEVEYYALVVLCRDLVERRNWLGKLERLAELARPEVRGNVLSLVDGVVADVVGVPTALQDILGYQRNLAQALCSIADLWEGCFNSERSDAHEQITVFGPYLADGRLESTRRALMERLLRQLSSVQPLDRHEPGRERDAFRQVAGRLFRPNGFLGGPATAAALTRRFSLLLEGGGPAALRQSVAGVAAAMPDRQFRFVYLAELAASELGGELIPAILAQFREEMNVSTLEALVPQGLPPKGKLMQATGLYNTVVDASAVPESDRVALLMRLDQLLSQYLQRSGIVEKLDDPNAPLRDRATRLVQFCAAAILPAQSHALQWTRERVISLLRQPDFDMRFIEGIVDLQQSEEALRNFHALLVRAGFQ
jgi:hypothetical protein